MHVPNVPQVKHDFKHLLLQNKDNFMKTKLNFYVLV